MTEEGVLIKSLEKKLTESERRFRSLIDNTDTGYFRIDTDGYFQEVNPAWLKMHGFSSAKQVIGQHFSMTQVDLDMPAAQLIVEGLLKGEYIPPGVFNRKRKDGSIGYHTFTASPVIEDGIVVGLEGFMIEVTERKQVAHSIYLMSDTQKQIAHLDSLTEIYQLVGQSIQELIGDGYVGITMLDEDIQATRIVGLYGFGNLFKNLVRRFRVDPTKFAYYLKDMTADELRQFRSARLEIFEGGLYHLLTRKVPESICDAAAKILNITGIYTMGFVWQGLHFGGLTIFAKCDLDLYKDMIETIMNQATISIKRIKSEDALRKSEDRYRDLVENSQLLICTHDLEGKILSANPWASKVLGYELDTILQMNIRDFIVPEARARFDEYLVEIQQHGAAKGYLLVQTATGKRRIWEYNNSLRTEGVGKPIVRGIAYDITERMHAEEALRESEKRYRTLVENIPGAVYRNQPAPPWDMTYVSGGIEALTGYPASFFEGDFVQQYNNILLPEDYEIATQPLATALVDKLPYQFEYRIRHADGTTRWVHEKGRVVCSKQGEPLYLDGVILDITERKLAEEALRETQKLASMGSLAAGIAHEINSPLQVITGLSERIINQLERGQLDQSKLTRDIANINRLAWNIAHIIRALLTYACETQGQVASQDLNEIIKDTLLLTEHQLKTWENINISTDFGKNLPPLSCERNQIVQVLINLLNNARDAMPHGGDITLLTRYDTDEKRFLLQVTDTGMGMSDEVKKKIFDPFFTTKPIGQGTGLGLSIVFGIIKAHDGDIEVESAPEKGTTFLVYLPDKQTAPPLPDNKETEEGRYEGQAG